jgi:CHASE3 domain sensor protein
VRQTELADMTLLSVLEGAETGQRGYLLTGNRAYLVPYEAARRRLAKRFAWLKRASSLEPEQARRVTELQRLVQKKMAEMSRTIWLQDAGQRQAALDLVETNQGKRLMDAIRIKIHAIELDAERQLAAQRWHNQVRTKWVTAIHQRL